VKIYMIKNWLYKPFPLIESLKDQMFMALLAGLVVFLFLAVFQPFGISTEHEGIFKHLAGYGLITTIVVAICFFLTSRLLPNSVYKDNWTIGKNVILILIILILISILNFIYGQYVSDQIYMQGIVQTYTPGLILWIFMTFSVGIFPVFFIIYIAEKRLFKRNKRIAGELNKGIYNSGFNNKGTQISLDLGKNISLEINSAKFICVQAEGGNYSTVFWIDNSDIKKQIFRITLQNFMEQVDSDINIIRCHKSYIVNRNHVESVVGNARSLLLRINGLDFEVPVSRSFPRDRLMSSK